MKNKRTVCIIILKIVLMSCVVLGISKIDSYAAENFGEFYELQGNTITRILPQTTVLDFKNNMEDDNIVILGDTNTVISDNQYVGSGMTAKINGNSYNLSVIGELDGNGKIGITDLVKSKLHTVSIKQVESKFEKSLDVNNSGDITITDLTQLNLALVGIKDFIAPESFTPTATISGQSITVTGNTIDINGKISEYYFKIDDGEWVQNEDKTNGTYTFNDVDLEVNHKIRMKVKDQSGNQKKTSTIQVGKENPEISITINPEKWTNDDVTVYVYVDKDGPEYEKYISTSSVYSKYIKPIKVSSNATVNVILKNKAGETVASKSVNIDKIDKLAPKEFTPIVEKGTDSITVNAQTEDEEATSQYAKSGIKEYEYILKDGLYHWSVKTTQTSYTFSTLALNKDYTLEVVAIDNAGNTRSATVEIPKN